MTHGEADERGGEKRGLRCATVLIGAALLTPASVCAPAATPAGPLASCAGDCGDDGAVTIDDIIILVNIAGGSETTAACVAGNLDGNEAITIDEIVAAVGSALQGCPAAGTPIPSATHTPQPAPTPLGRRRFVIDPATSVFEAVIAPGFPLKVGGFRGETDGVVEDAYLDFEAGAPDATGTATIAVVGASEYIFVNGANIGIVLCLKPRLPVPAAGVVACNGGFDFSIVTAVDHNIGRVGVDGFDAGQCEGAGGTVEGPNQICSTGAVGDPCRNDGDCDAAPGAACGLGEATCSEGRVGETCRSDATCDIDPALEEGVCGSAAAHPGVCNGSLQLSQSLGDSGPGAAIIAPVPQLNISGLPLVLTIERATPCGDEGPGLTQPFAITTARSRTTIANFNNGTTTLELERAGRNFSCDDWSHGPARFVLNFPALHQFQDSDVLTVFTFEDPGTVR